MVFASFKKSKALIETTAHGSACREIKTLVLEEKTEEIFTGSCEFNTLTHLPICTDL
jgi:hypothetical protein